MKLKRQILPFFYWWLGISVITFLLILFDENSGLSNKYYPRASTPLTDIIPLLPNYLKISIFMGFCGTVARKVYYLVYSILFFTEISSEPLPELLRKKNKLY